MWSHIRVEYETDAPHARCDFSHKLKPFVSHRFDENRETIRVRPGRARLATKPLPTGSPRDANTIGIVAVSRRTVSVTWLVLVTITLGAIAISSLAKLRAFSGSPPAQR